MLNCIKKYQKENDSFFNVWKNRQFVYFLIKDLIKKNTKITKKDLQPFNKILEEKKIKNKLCLEKGNVYFENFNLTKKDCKKEIEKTINYCQNINNNLEKINQIFSNFKNEINKINLDQFTLGRIFYLCFFEDGNEILKNKIDYFLSSKYNK